MVTQDQIDFTYPLVYTVVKGDWILKIADKYAIEGLSRDQRAQQIIEENSDFLLPRSGYNTLGELLVGEDFILPGDNLTIPPYILPNNESKSTEPKLLAEYTICSDVDGIIGTLQIFQYPENPNNLEPVAIMKNFPEGYIKQYTFGSETPYSNDFEFVANKFLSEDLNPDLKEINLAGDMRLCNDLPYTISGVILSADCGSPIEGVLIEDDNGSSTYTDKNGEYALSGTYEPVENQEGTPPPNILDKEDPDSISSTMLPELEVTTTGLPLVQPRPPAYSSSPQPELRTLPQKEMTEAEVINMSKAEIIDANLINTSPTPTPIDSFNKATSPERTEGPLPIYEDEEENKDKKKKNKRKKIKEKRKLGWDISFPSFPKRSSDRKKLFKKEKDQVKEQRKLQEEKEKSTPEGKKQKEKREKNKLDRAKKLKEKKLKKLKNKQQKIKDAKNQIGGVQDKVGGVNDKIKDTQDKIDKFNNPPPTISCGKKNWCRKSIPLIGLNGLPRPSLGTIQLEPFDPKFPKLQRPEFVFPDLELKELTLPKVNFDMKFQLEMNKLQIKLKKNLIPLIGMLLSRFNICDIPKALALLAAGKAFKDLGVSCPENPEELLKLIEKRNRLTKVLNNIYKFLKKVNITIETTDKIITAADVALIAAQVLTFIPITPVTPLPTATANVVEEIDKRLKKFKIISTSVLIILSIILRLLARILQMLSLLDNAIATCSDGKNPNDKNTYKIPPELISNELLLATQQQATQAQPIVRKINGFDLDVVTVENVEIQGEKRRQAIAKNPQGVIMLRGEASFSSNDQILIDELVFYIQQNDLKAE